MKSTKRRTTQKQPPLFPDAGPAMLRAARRAREIARRFGTPIYISRGGKVVALKP